MRILLVSPFVIVPRDWIPYFPQEPLGLEYLAASLPYPHEVRILDCVAEAWTQHSKLRDGSFWVGASLEQIRDRIVEFEPQIVGITMQFCNQEFTITEISKLVKRINSNIITIVGGCAACAEPEKLMERHKDIDIIVMGEGELILREIADKQANGLDTIKGLVYRSRDKILRNADRPYIQDIDQIPFPARHLVDFDIYSLSLHYSRIADKLRIIYNWLRYNHDWSTLEVALFSPRARALPKHAAIVTSRGCPFHCTFCSTQNAWRRHYRQRSVKNVLDEVDDLYHQLGVRTLNILDDNFNVNNEWVVEFCKGILERELKLELRLQDGLYVTPKLDRETLSLLKIAGLKDVFFGVESGNPRVLNEVINKRIDLDKVMEIAQFCKEVGITSGGYFLIGLPGEKISEMEDTIDFALKSGLDKVRFYICQPLPGSQLYDDCVRNGWLTNGYDPSKALLMGSESYITTEDFAHEDVSRLAGIARDKLQGLGKLAQRGK